MTSGNPYGGSGSTRGPLEIPSSNNGLNAFLEEIAKEFGIPDYFEHDKGDFPARVHGYIGGNSVRAFSYFAQNFLRTLPKEEGAKLLKEYGLHIPQEEKSKVTEYLNKMGYVPNQSPQQDEAVVEGMTANQAISPQLTNNFVHGSNLSGAQMAEQNRQQQQGNQLH